MGWTTPTEQRYQALAPFISGLGLEYGKDEGREIPETLSLGGHSIDLDPWVRAVLQESLSRSSGGESWAPLVAEGLAFRIKCRTQIDQVQLLLSQPDTSDASSKSTEQALERVIVDISVGLALLEETQRAIDALMTAGDMKSAKKLTGFRHKVGESLDELKKQIGDESVERAENKSRGMIAETRTVSAVARSSATGAPGEWGQESAGRMPWDAADNAEPEYVPDIGSSRRAAHLGMLLAVVTLVWLIFVFPRYLERTPHILELDEFTHLPGLYEISPRPPSLFAKVYSARWNSMTEAERTEFVDDVARVAESAGYVGIQLRTDNEVAVAQWLKKTGVRIFDTSNAAGRR